MGFEEFKEYPTRQYFILLLDKAQGHHYVIGKKARKGIYIWDPAEGKKYVTYEALRYLYMNIFITISHDDASHILPEKLKENREIYDIRKIGKLLLINVVVFGLSIMLTLLLKYSFMHLSNGLDMTSLSTIIFSMSLIYLLYHFGEYIERALVIKHKEEYYRSLNDYLLEKLLHKKASFPQKIGQHLHVIREHIGTIATYHAEYLNKWMISIISLVVVAYLLLHINAYFVAVIILSFLLQHGFNYWYKKHQDRYLPPLNAAQALSIRRFNFLRRFIDQELNAEKLPVITSQYSKAFNRELLLESKMNNHNIVLYSLNEALNNYLYLLIFSSIAIFIYLNLLDFSSLAIITFLYTQINKACNNLSNYYSFRNRYIYAKKIYSQAINIDDIEASSNTMALPKAIYIKHLFYCLNSKIIFRHLDIEILPNTFIYGPSGTGKSVLYKLISGKLQSPDPCIYFDKRAISEIEASELKNTIIYQVSNGYIVDRDIKPLIDSLCLEIRKYVINICSMLHIDPYSSIDPKALSSGQKQFLNILPLLRYSNRILLLDEIASHINLETKIYIFRYLMPYIASRNFLICSEHNMELKALFKHHIDLQAHAE